MKILVQNMDHLNEETLNAYLDAALEAAAQAEAGTHLATCPECAVRLESLRAVFASLETLPEASLARDLSVGVVRAIKAKPVVRPALTPAIRIAFVFQGLLALVALAVAIPFAAQLVTTTFALPSFELQVSTLQSLISNLLSLFTLPTPEAFIPTGLFTLPAAEFSTLAITVCLAAVTLLWFVGNGLLLRPARKVGR